MLHLVRQGIGIMVLMITPNAPLTTAAMNPTTPSAEPPTAPPANISAAATPATSAAATLAAKGNMEDEGFPAFIPRWFASNKNRDADKSRLPPQGARGEKVKTSALVRSRPRPNREDWR